MVNLNFKVVRKNDSLNGEQRVSEVSFNPAEDANGQATHRAGAVIGTPNTPQLAGQGQVQSSVTSSGFTITFVGSEEEASFFEIGKTYQMNITAVKAPEPKENK